MRSVDWPGRWLQDRLGYEPRDLALFRAALTHRSASGPNNERLEFLGDAVLNLIIAHHLYAAFPQAAEGDLSLLRARLVSREPLAEVALTLGLGETLQLGSGELRSGGFRRQSILADALEAVCGANSRAITRSTAVSPPSRNSAPQTASSASARIDWRRKPPLLSSPDPSCRVSPRPSVRATSASGSRLTSLARRRLRSPSAAWGKAAYSWCAMTRLRTASPRN